MIKIKICGIKRDEDVQYVNEYLPDYIGLVFAESKRKVTIEKAKVLTSNLDNKIKKVGVFVNAQIGEIVEAARECSLDVVQLHGDETSKYLEDLNSEVQKNQLQKLEIWKAIRVKDTNSLSNIKRFVADAYVLDTYIEGSYGGAGQVFDWKLAIDAKQHGEIILAGGLACDNVADAVSLVQPFAVDVSSGVETEGVKDRAKIREFISRVRNRR